MNLDPETFVREWQRAPTLSAFCRKTGAPKDQARTRAHHMRKRGIPLKRMSKGRDPLDVEGLKALALSLAEGGEE